KTAGLPASNRARAADHEAADRIVVVIADLDSRFCSRTARHALPGASNQAWGSMECGSAFRESGSPYWPSASPSRSAHAAEAMLGPQRPIRERRPAIATRRRRRMADRLPEADYPERDRPAGR